ncbi:MAG: sodium:solute symporter [Halobaculum sp.]
MVQLILAVAGLLVALLGAVGVVGIAGGSWPRVVRRVKRAVTVSTSEEFFVGDRTVGRISGGATLAATQISAGTLVGTVGIHYLTGVSFVLIWLGIWAGWLTSALLIAPQLNEFGGLTVPDYLASRFDLGYDGAAIRCLSALLIVLSYLVYTSAQYLAAGRVFEALFGVTLLVLLYMTVGGMRASITTDVIQMVLLTGGAAVAAVVALVAVGGPVELYGRLAGIDPSLVGLGIGPVRLVGIAVAFGFAVMVAPNELSRMYTMEDPDTVRSAIAVSIGIQSVVAVSVAVLGLVARVRFPGLTTPDTAVIRLVTSLFGPVIGVVLILAVLAAVLSTVDSVLLVSASALAHDFYAEVLPSIGVLATAPSEESVLRASKLTTVVAGVVPLGFALFPGPFGGLVQLIVAFYASLIGGTLLVPLLAGFHWSGARASGAVAGMLGGFTATVVWQLAVRQGDRLQSLAVVDPVVPGVAVSALLLVAVSLWVSD